MKMEQIVIRIFCWLLLVMLARQLISAHNDPDFHLPHRGCYYTNWSQYRKGRGKFTVTDINPGLCSYIVVAFAKIDNNTLTTLEWNDEDTFRELVALRDVNGHSRLKILLSIGGWTLSHQLVSVSSSHENRESFAASVVKNLRYWELDGLDVDWEYPDAAIKPQYSAFLMDLRGAFEKDAQQTGRTRLALAAAVHFTSDGGYDGRILNQTLDFVHVMAYDLHGAWIKDKTGHHAPLFKGPFGLHSKESVSAIVKAWEHLGVARSKLVIGLPLYGRGWQLMDTRRHGLGAAAQGPINASAFTGEAGAWPYYEICERLQKDNATFVFDENIQAGYAFTRDIWMGFDDRATVLAKSKWVKDNGYGGVYIWDLAQDDFLNTCHQGSFPLLNAVFEALEGSRLPARQPSTSTLARTRTIAYTQAPSTVAVVSSAPRTTTTRSTTAAVVVATPARHHLSHGKSTTTRGPTENVSPFAGKPVLPKLSLGKKVCDKLFCVWNGIGSFALGKCEARYCDCDAGSNPYGRECIGGLVYDGASKFCNWQENVEGCARFSSFRTL